MKKQKIKIDIVSDIICPWCYVGEYRLKQAMAEAGDQYEFEISFKAFELNPNIPQEGQRREDYFLNNYGPAYLPQMDKNDQRLAEAGQALGIALNFGRVPKVYNTFNGHRLIWLAGAYGVQAQVADALFRHYFTEGHDVNDIGLLTQIGVAHGIPVEKLEAFFSGDAGKAEVRALEQQAHAYGITGVPAFIINDKFLVRGAQPAETFLQVFPQVVPAAEVPGQSGESCGIDGC